jgi:hypothetical protein
VVPDPGVEDTGATPSAYFTSDLPYRVTHTEGLKLKLAAGSFPSYGRGRCLLGELDAKQLGRFSQLVGYRRIPAIKTFQRKF